jgi:exosortase/archaeosortase family protein
VLTVTSSWRTPGTEYVLTAAAWAAGIFATLRLAWVETHVVLPAIQLQAALGAAIRLPTAPVEVTLACSGTDALALCIGAVLAFPVSWINRVTAAAAGTLLLLVLNTARIASLGHAAATPAWFDALHLYIWPAILTVAIAAYVFTWMRFADPQRQVAAPMRPYASRQFVLLTIVFGLIFVLLAPLYLESAAVLMIAGIIARTAAVILTPLGVSATAIGNVLWTPAGGFMVTQECISTPLIPIYLSAVFSFARNKWLVLLGIVALVPLFTVLGTVRLLLVAMPGALQSSLFAVHAFYQVLLGVVVVVAAALWRHERRRAVGFAVAGLCAAGVFLYLFGHLYTRLVTYGSAPFDDPQGAIAFLPSFQVALYVALSVAAFTALGWRHLLGGVVLLGCTQVGGMLLLHLLIEQEALVPHVRDVRGWAIVAPILMIGAVTYVARTRV